MKPRYLPVLMLIAGIAGIIFAGCSDGDFYLYRLTPENKPPTVWVSSGPPSGSTTAYTVEIFWGGWDPDGFVAYYEYCITDNDNGVFDPADTTGRDKWNRLDLTRGEFKFTADRPADPESDDIVAEFVRSHTFFVRAVDNEGLPSPQPAHRSFTARTLSPTVTITHPPAGGLAPSFVPAIAWFSWTAKDYVDDLASVIEPDSVSWILESTYRHNNSYDETTEYIRSLPVDSPEWGDWVWYGAPDDAGKSWTTPPLEFEPYVFAIRAKDEAGAITPVFDLNSNVRRIGVHSCPGSLILTVRNEFIGAVTTAHLFEPVTIADIMAGVPLEFCLKASADHYGGVVTGYRYGWDVTDLSDPEQWDTDYIPYPGGEVCLPAITFNYGTHTLTVEVIDNSGYRSRVEFKINIIQFTMERNLLLVDDYTEDTQVGWDDPVWPGAFPSDEEHDSFWEDVLVNLSGFYPAGDVFEVSPGDAIPLTELARYKSIIWNVNGNVDDPAQSVLHDLIGYTHEIFNGGGGGGKRRPNPLALFAAAGGHLLICGNHPVSMVITPPLFGELPGFPIIFLYDLCGGRHWPESDLCLPPYAANSFAYKELCLETMDYAWMSGHPRRGYPWDRPGANLSGSAAVPERDQTMRSAIPYDLAFPRLELRDEVTGVYDWYHESRRGYDSETYNPVFSSFIFDPYPVRPRDCFEPIYMLECLDPVEASYGAPVAFWTSQYADRIADAPGALAARNAVFGFPPVYFKPDQVRGAIEAIVFDEWQLPRK